MRVAEELAELKAMAKVENELRKVGLIIPGRVDIALRDGFKKAA